MENKILELAVFQPYAYPWTRNELGIDIEEINNILKDNGLNDEVSRRKAGYELDITCYLAAVKAKDYEDLKKRVFDALKDKKYISQNLIEKGLVKKFLANVDEVKAYIKFINNNMTIDEKKSFEKAIPLWLVDLFYYYEWAVDSNVKSATVKGNIAKIVEKNYAEHNSVLMAIDRLIKVRGFNRSYIIKIVNEVSVKFKNELSELLDKYIVKSDDKTTESFFEDELFDIINNVSDFELGDSSEDKEENEEVLIEEEDKLQENLSEVKNEVQETPSYVKENQVEIKGNKIEINLNGYKLVKLDNEFEEDTEIELLKELASYKKGAVLSELYNAYVNFDNVSKDNLEAIIERFFNRLKLEGFEADDANLVGEKVSLDTKDLLSDFVLTSPINEKGIIEGEVKYLPWLYKGKKVTPMVVKPLNR